MAKTKQETANLPSAEDQQHKVPMTMGDDMFAQHAGAGMENITKDDLLVPRLTILQALSPQLKKTKPEYIEGAQAGMICDVGTGELFGDKVLFLPVHFSKVWLEWAPRDSGKGLIAIHQTPKVLDFTTRNDRGQPILPNGNYVSETSQFFGFNLDADGRRSFIPMASTMLKRARRWNMLATSEKAVGPNGEEFTPPMFYRAYQLSVVEDGNSQGDWFSWKVERAAKLSELSNAASLFKAAVEFLEQVKSGEAQGQIDEESAIIEESSEERPM